MFDPSKRRDTAGRSVISCILNEINESIPNRSKKYSLCGTELDNLSKNPYK